MILDMWKNKNTYRFVKIVGVIVVTGVSITTVGSALLGDKNNSISNERKRVMKERMKERKLQIPEFMRKDMNVPAKVKENNKALYYGGDVDPEDVALTAVQIAEKVGNYYSYVHEVEECVMADEVKEEVKEECKSEYVCTSRPQEVEELSEPHKEKLIRYIKGMSVAEQLLVLECIPVELCMMRISKEISELKEFKSTINGAMSALEGKF